MYDRVIVQELIKEIAQNQPLDISTAVQGVAAPVSTHGRGFKGLFRVTLRASHRG